MNRKQDEIEIGDWHSNRNWNYDCKNIINANKKCMRNVK